MKNIPMDLISIKDGLKETLMNVNKLESVIESLYYNSLVDNKVWELTDKIKGDISRDYYHLSKLIGYEDQREKIATILNKYKNDYEKELKKDTGCLPEDYRKELFNRIKAYDEAIDLIANLED